MANRHLCVAIYTTHNQADEAFSRFQARGFGMDVLSFVGRDYWRDMVGSRNAGERFLYRGIHGAFWEKLWAVLKGWGVFWLFDSGPMVVAGSLVRTIVATQEEGNGNGHASGFEAALAGIGIPPDSLIEYEKALKNDQILVFIEGTLHEIDQAQDILHETKAINHTVHHGATN